VKSWQGKAKLTKHVESECMMFNLIWHSFIHTEHLHSASSRELLRGAPDSSTAKKSSLNLRKNAGDKALSSTRQASGDVEAEKWR